jgi:hypothetical protein
MSVPLWVFIISVLILTGILIHQNKKWGETAYYHKKTWDILNRYILKYGMDDEIIKNHEKIFDK